jgi:hypothetical protein
MEEVELQPQQHVTDLLICDPCQALAECGVECGAGFFRSEKKW